MKRIPKEHDKTAGLCRSCRKRVETTYRYRDVDLDEPDVTVSNVLVAVCDQCNEIGSVPWQSNERLQVARRVELEWLANASRIEARVPSERYEYLRLIAAQLEAREGVFTNRAPRRKEFLVHLAEATSWRSPWVSVRLRAPAAAAP